MSKALTPDHLMAILARRKEYTPTSAVPGFVYCDDVDALAAALAGAQAERDRLSDIQRDALLELGVVLAQFSLQPDLYDAIEEVHKRLRP